MRKPQKKFKKEMVTCTIAVHSTQARIIKGLQKGEINLDEDSLRVIGKKVGADSPQKVKHHLEILVSLGVINIINGSYNYQK